MKKCTNCQISKLPAEFYEQVQISKVNDTKWKYLDSFCKECRSKYVSTRRRAAKIQGIEYKGGKCHQCGLIDVPEVYDFHHINPDEKEFDPFKQSLKFEKIKAELDKCILVCANCHRKIHGYSKADIVV